MQITLTWQTFVGIAGGLAAIIAIVGYYNKVYDFVKRQKEQDTDFTEFKKRHDADIADIKGEQAILTYGILACLKGLQEQGADGPVVEAIDKIEKHLNEKAHGG